VRQVRLDARTLLAGDAVSPDRYLRLRLVEQRAGELAGFVAPGGGDHVRVIVGTPDGGDVALDESGAPLGESRTETVVDHDVEQGWIDLDVLVHAQAGGELGELGELGVIGVMGAWAARAPLGSPAVITGPKGSVVLTGAPGEVILAGDDSALPAVRRYLRMLGPDVTGHLVLETHFDLAALGIEPPAGMRVSILSPDRDRPSAAIVHALEALAAPADPLERFVFACGERSIVAPVRALLAAWGIDVERAVVKGYWKR